MIAPEAPEPSGSAACCAEGLGLSGPDAIYFPLLRRGYASPGEA
ncbi:MAG TPA: hypothetical protein VKO18_15365 [Terriglobia bacterium]|nr:hypothetical protein [Terriglobia bacterium]